MSKVMTEDERFDEARSDMEQAIERFREQHRKLVEDDEGDGPFCYGISHEVISTLVLAGGGPSTYIEYNHSTGLAKYVTTEPDYANRQSLTPDVVEIGYDESAEIAAMFDLEFYARDAAASGQMEF
jgi:hypothetical protein